MWTRLNGQRLKFYRGLHDMTQDELSSRVGITKQHLGGIERGVHKPSLELLAKACEVLEVDPVNLFVAHAPTDQVQPSDKEPPSRCNRLVDASGTWLISLAHGKETWSRSLYSMLGLAPSRKPSLKLFLKRLLERDVPAFAAFYRQLAKGEKPRSMTCALVRAKGKQRTLHVQADVFPGQAEGEPGQACAVFMDVTESMAVYRHVLQRQENLQEIVEDRTRALAVAVVQAEKELSLRFAAECEARASHARLERLLAAVPAIIYSFSPDVGDKEWHSRHLQRIFGYAHRDFHADPMLWLNAIHDEDQPAVRRAIARAQEGRSLDMTYRIRTKTGRMRWLHDMAVPGRDEDGRFLLTGVAIDVTDRKLAEESLARSRNMLASAERLAGMCSVEWNPETDTWMLSDNWRRITGLARSWMTSRELFAMLHPDDIRRMMRGVVKTIKTGRPCTIQHRIIRGDTGAVRHMQTYGVAECTPSGHPFRMYATMVDISDKAPTDGKDARLLICGYSPDGVINHANPACRGYLGKTRSDVKGASFLELIPKEDHGAFLDGIARLSPTTPVHVGEHVGIAPGGAVHRLRWTTRALFDAQSRITGYQSFGKDVTEH